MNKFLVNTLAPSNLLSNKQRVMIYRALGMKAGKNLQIAEGCRFYSLDPDLLSIGNEVFINYGVTLDNQGGITIGNGCDIGMNVQIITPDHNIGAYNKRAGRGCYPKRVVIEYGCWIGAGAIILPGITIERGCIIGAGAVVTKSCAKDGLYVGNPAKRIRDLP